LVDKLQAAYPGSAVRVPDLAAGPFPVVPSSLVKVVTVVHDLAAGPFPHLEKSHLDAFNAPVETHSPAQQAAVRHSDEAIRELLWADIIVIGMPMYNFNIPSTLKAWIDHIARARITFRYTASGPEGLVQGKKVYLAASSGGIYSQGPGPPMILQFLT
jgi:FMN-dependent NADH-azoreductase